jgi:hypothetical protein
MHFLCSVYCLSFLPHNLFSLLPSSFAFVFILGQREDPFDLGLGTNRTFCTWSWACS